MDKETAGERADVRLSVNIDVDDLAKGVDFYRRVFGLQPGRNLFGGTVAELLGAPVPIYLLAKPPGSGAVAGRPLHRDYGRHWTPVHLDFEVDDLEAAVERAVAAGARVEGGGPVLLLGAPGEPERSLRPRLLPVAVHRRRLCMMRPSPSLGMPVRAADGTCPKVGGILGLKEDRK